MEFVENLRQPQMPNVQTLVQTAGPWLWLLLQGLLRMARLLQI